jgi:hypothetical protein
MGKGGGWNGWDGGLVSVNPKSKKGSQTRAKRREEEGEKERETERRIDRKGIEKNKTCTMHTSTRVKERAGGREEESLGTEGERETEGEGGIRK